jgi:hypothetical protein
MVLVYKSCYHSSFTAMLERHPAFSMQAYGFSCLLMLLQFTLVNMVVKLHKTFHITELSLIINKNRGAE